LDDEQRRFELMLHAARCESAPAELGERVLDHVQYRLRLEKAGEPQPASRAFGLTLLGCVLAAAAAVLAVRALATSSPLLVAEPAASVQRDRSSASSPKKTAANAALSVCIGRASAAGAAPLIDDFEDGDDAIVNLEQRSGFWRWAREIDAPGTAPALLPVPRPQRTRGNELALHVKGGRLLDWGATVEFTFRPACYDASVYQGVAFLARGPGRIYVSPREVGVIPSAEGGSCERDCHNPHVIKIDLDGQWRTYQVRWSELRQRGYDKPALDASRLHSLAFLIRPEDTPYDVWLDDVRFLPR
jgi:hypothetical protein